MISVAVVKITCAAEIGSRCGPAIPFIKQYRHNSEHSFTSSDTEIADKVDEVGN